MFALKLKQKLTLFAKRISGTKRASIAATLTWTLKTNWNPSSNLNKQKTALFSSKNLQPQATYFFSFLDFYRFLFWITKSQRCKLEYKFSIQNQYDLLLSLCLPMILVSILVMFLFGCCQNLAAYLRACGWCFFLSIAEGADTEFHF